MNGIHSSILICPITTNVFEESEFLRLHLKIGQGNLQKPSDVMIDQIRTIDKKRLLRKIGDFPRELSAKLQENLKVLLDID